MKNIRLKVISLLLATVVWAVVSAPRSGRIVERALSASVSLVGMSGDFVIVTPTTIPEKVSIRVRGRKPDLDALTSRTLEATVDLRWLQQSGEATITLRPHVFNVPQEVEVVSIEPSQFRFRVEELRQRAVTIRPALVGDVPDGYVVGELTVNPDRALVSGPASQILAMDEVGTERIIMTGRTATFVQNPAVVTDSPLVRVVSPLTAQVTVNVSSAIGPELPDPSPGTTDETGTAPPVENRSPTPQ